MYNSYKVNYYFLIIPSVAVLFYRDYILLIYFALVRQSTIMVII